MDLMLTDAPVHYAGSGFPWGLLIIGGILYVLWTKGVFDGRGRFGNGGRFGGGYGPGPGSGPGQTQMTGAPGYGPGSSSGQGAPAGYSEQRAAFEEWHRQVHASGMTHEAPAAPQAPVAPQAPGVPEAPAAGENDQPRQV